MDVTCPGDHHGCTATLEPGANAGDEKGGGRRLADIVTRGDEPISVDNSQQMLMVEWPKDFLKK